MSSDAAHPLLAVEITIDCANAAVLAEFWKAAVGYVDDGDRVRGRPGCPTRGESRPTVR